MPHLFLAIPARASNLTARRVSRQLALILACAVRTTSCVAKLTAKPAIDSKQRQTTVDDEAPRGANCGHQQTTENKVRHFGFFGLGPGGIERMVVYPIIIWEIALGAYLMSGALSPSLGEQA